jgi:hypothetical protein
MGFSLLFNFWRNNLTCGHKNIACTPTEVRPESGQSEVQNAGFHGNGRAASALQVSALQGVTRRTAYDKLSLAPVVQTSLYVGEVHLNFYYQKNKTKKTPNLTWTLARQR